MKVDDEMVENACQTWLLQSLGVTIGHAMKVSIQAALDAMPKQEPVAYMLHVYGETVYTEHPEDFSDKAVITPLYTNPQPHREPLSAREVERLIFDDHGTNAIDLVRAVEKAHGIGV